MAQHDYDIANASGAAVRADMNNLAAAIVSLNSGAAAPASTFAYQYWADTTNAVLKQRDSGNANWIVRASLDAAGTLAKSANYTVAINDYGKLIDCSSTFTLSFTAAATLGTNFFFGVRNSGTGIITLDPNGTETIDSATTIKVYQGEAFLVFCDGSNFITVGRATGLVLIEEKTASASASLDFTTGIDSEFDTYEFELIGVVATAADPGLTLRVQEGGAFKSGATDYKWVRHFTTSTATDGGQGSEGATSIGFSRAVGNDAARDGLYGTIRFHKPASTGLIKRFMADVVHGDTVDTQYRINSGGSYVANGNPITGVQFLFDSGTIASGTIRLYGIRK